MALGLVLAAVAFAAMAALVRRRFVSALAAHRARVGRGSSVIASPFGQIEYAATGEGEPVLIAHGAGGGFDQGIDVAGELVPLGFRIIVPSRFGYLRSTSPADSSPGSQADAFAALLDALKIDTVHVIGLSVGALSALQFGVRHPRRCRSLTVIVPAASSVMSPQGPLPEQGRFAMAVVQYVVGSDFLYWLGLTVAPTRMMRSVLGTPPSVVAQAGADERQRALDMLRNVLPVSARSNGLLNDTRFASAPQAIPVERITVPTLVVSLEDDLYRTVQPARAIAAAVPGARLLTYPSGGHAFIGRSSDLFRQVAAFLGGK